jgi:hypothetical protein
LTSNEPRIDIALSGFSGSRYLAGYATMLWRGEGGVLNRRSLLGRVGAAAAVLSVLRPSAQAAAQASSPSARRVRPSDPEWPSAGSWERLNQEVGGRLIRVQSPLAACDPAQENESCREAVRKLQNPYFIGDQAGATQSSGWADAWNSTPSVYAVAARNTGDVAAAVNFARENNLRLVVKGGGHSYQGTSNAAILC